MQYLIMHKDLPLTVADFSEDGRLIQYSHNYKNADYLPLHAPKDINWLINWWNEHAVPVKQGKVHEMLTQQGIYCSEEYLLRNLGLSLTDCYWIKPVDSTLMWKDVNFYQNMFRNEMVIEKAAGVCGKQLNLSPNSSLQGQLEKKWIISNDTRYLVKASRH